MKEQHYTVMSGTELFVCILKPKQYSFLSHHRYHTQTNTLQSNCYCDVKVHGKVNEHGNYIYAVNDLVSVAEL